MGQPPYIFAGVIIIVKFKNKRIMVFNLKMTITLKNEFIIEAEHLKDAREIAEKQLLEEVDLNTLEVDRIGLDMTDPSIREYNGKMCREILKAYKEKNGNKH